MCLAIPGRIEKINDLVAEVNYGGVKKNARLDLLVHAKVGDYILVHAGFAIQILDEKEAEETLEILREAFKGVP